MPPVLAPARPAVFVSPDVATPALGGDLLRLHAALTQRELWDTLRTLAHNALPSPALTLEVDGADDGGRSRVYRQGPALGTREPRIPHPARAWLAQNPGRTTFRLSDVIPLRELRATPYYERVMHREGWDKQLAIVSWAGRNPRGILSFYRTPDESDFSLRELRLAETIQPHFDTALRRVLGHEDAVFLGQQLATLLEDAPVGLLVLDWELRPLWYNREGAHACAVWNHGERRAAALNPKRTFRVPAALVDACSDLRRSITQPAEANGGHPSRVLSEHALGLHAQVAIRTVGAHPLARPAFHIQLDYRRPRGDRNRPLSPGAVALLARLSPREREVAMRVREGLSTRDIAAELHRSPLTIKTQLAAIFRKLEVQTRTRVAALLNR